MDGGNISMRERVLTDIIEQLLPTLEHAFNWGSERIVSWQS